MTNMYIRSARDLVTSEESRGAWYKLLSIQREELAETYLQEARTLKYLLRKGPVLDELKGLKANDISISDSNGDGFVDELVYRYLLTKGDALGGKARNLAGVLGERKFLRSMLSVFNLSGVNYQWKDDDTDTWLAKPEDDTGIEKRSICEWIVNL
jgi:hypothetical protein